MASSQDNINSPNDENRSPFELPNEATSSGQRSPATMVAEGKRKRVGFTSDTSPASPVTETTQRYGGDTPESPAEGFTDAGILQGDIPETVIAHDIPDITEDARRDIYQALGKAREYTPKPQPKKPALRKSFQPPEFELRSLSDLGLDSEDAARHLSSKDAHVRASKLAAKVESYHASAAPSRSGSVDLDITDMETNDDSTDHEGHIKRRGSEDSDDAFLYQNPPQRLRSGSLAQAHDEASRLVRSYTQRYLPSHYENDESPLQSGQITPIVEQREAEYYIPKPSKYRGGVLTSLLKLANGGHQRDSSVSSSSYGRHDNGPSRGFEDFSPTGTTPVHTPGQSPPGSGTTTPTHGKHRKFIPHWTHSRHGSESPNTLGALLGSSLNVAYPSKEVGEQTVKQYKQRPGIGKRTRSSEGILHAWKKIHSNQRDHEIKITKHIAQTIARQKYIVKLCRALMDYGAPTHRLEEYLKMSSRVLEIDAQFLYIPGCMLISFDDPTTHTTEVKLVRTPQGVNLGKLRDTHQIYKEVVHDQIDVNDAMTRLERVMARPNKFPDWFRILVYGFAAASVGPFAFEARPIDLPIAFGLGCILGTLQLKVAPRSDLYANVFEIVAAAITSFLARAFGSISRPDGSRYFCFSALAQSSIALILPGYTVLCASLELQSRSIVAGSVRMVYAIIYSLFLGYSITIGTVIYGYLDHNATSATKCSAHMNESWYFFFVPIFTLCLIIVNQAKWKQAPVMLVISMTGYVVNFYSARLFRGNAQVTQTLGALTIGVMANVYGRISPTCENFFGRLWMEKIYPVIATKQQKLKDQTNDALRKLSSAETGEMSSAEREKLSEKGLWRERKGYGMAAAAMLPAIFVQVPSGLAVSGSLVSGVTSADQIVGNMTGSTTVSSGSDSVSDTNGAAFTVSLSVIQIAIGITVGLFISAVVVYPFGKRRSGLFSF
ncbi:uncharacterized protein PV09_04974 [Verruconis gallopava]|uniref:Threonine/serine exporter-like N-terminal domain-containing protein n=1 Tax=Verruconis gallopava TaxID=253628 RepID=A0A0D1XMD9_9PEZI|nr:uncharacterized protein PV09_04974 [Verruconis gallopava]KIW03651.1 hypothetical protein PV09_04974 [Verruconis gallopava]